MKKVCVAWQNEDWTIITTAKDWKKAKSQVVNQPSPEENGELPRRLVMEIEEQYVG